MGTLDFGSIFAAAPGPYLLLAADADYTILDVNHAYLAATMTTREQLVGKGLFDAFPDNPDDPEATGVRNLKASLEHVVGRGEPHTMAVQKYDIRRPDGRFEERHWSPVNTPVFGRDGKSVACIIHHVQDVTEFVRLKQLELALGRRVETADLRLRESEERLQLSTSRLAEFEERQRAEAALREVAGKYDRQLRLFEQVASTTPDFIYVFDRDFRILYANRRLLEVWGTTFEQAVGKSLIELGYPQWHADMHHRELREVVETKRPIKGEVSFTGGSGIAGVYEYIFTPVLGRDGEVEAIAGTTRDVTGRRTGERELQEALARWRAVVENMADGVVVADAAGNLPEWNAAALEMTGYASLDDVRRHLNDFPKVLELTSGDGRVLPLADWPMSRVLRGETFAGVEVMIRRLDTDLRRVISYGGSPVRDPQGNVMLAVLTLHDVTAERQAEEEVRRSQRQLASVIDNASSAIFIKDVSGRYLLVNAPFERITGVPVGSMAGKTDADVFPPEVAAAFREEDARVAGARQPMTFEETFEFKGEQRSFVTNKFPLRDDSGAVYAVCGIATDVTALKRAEASVRESEQRLRLGLRAGRTGTWDWDIATDRVVWSEQVYEFHGLRPDEFGGTGRDFIQTVHADDAERVGALIRSALHHGNPYEVEFRITRPSGEVRWLFTTGQVTRDDAGSPVRMMGAVIDTTDRKRAEAERERLFEAERAARAEAERASRMKDEFLATLSHELRTPLNAILGWAHLLAGGKRDEADVAEGLRTIERNARAQTRIIEDLLDMSRIISGKVRLDVQRVDLRAVLTDAVETVRPAAEAKGVRLQVVLDPLAGPVSGDPSRLQQVFWNLLSNAVKFTPRGGRVQVLLERVNSHLEISVTDTGEGISPEFLPHVFDRFRQSDATASRTHGGLGLGLAIAKQLVELHGGTIRAKSPGQGLGATFGVSLPLLAVHAEPAPAPERRHPSAGDGSPKPHYCDQIAGVRVLVVDDEPDARALIKALLEDCRAVVATAASAAEALAQFDGDPPDLLVSDIGMPGEDGYSFIRRVRALGPDRGGNVPAVALTAYARSEDRIRAIAAGFQHHVAKPVEPAELITMVADLAGRGRGVHRKA